MTAIRIFAMCTGLLAFAGTPTLAQTAASLAKPAAVTSAAASKSIPGRWTCVSRATIEIAPVSFDTSGSAEAWVMVHRVKGKVVAAERIDSSEVEKFRRMPCGDQGGVALVG
jgi:hypothetical protein